MCKDVTQSLGTNPRPFSEHDVLRTDPTREISRRDQLSHRNTNIIYMMSTRFSIDIKKAARGDEGEERERGRRRRRRTDREMEGEEDGEGEWI